MNTSPTRRESEHLAAVKALDCSVCGQEGPSEAHHIRQDCAYTVVALCVECHRGVNGWHGQKIMWRIHKMDELDALGVTLRNLLK